MRRPRTDVETIRAQQAERIDAWGRLLLGAVGLCLLAVGVRVVQLKLHPDPRLLAAAGSTTSVQQLLAPRGDILDRRGRLLATSVMTHDLFVDPQAVEDPSTIAVELARLVDLDLIEIDRRIQARLDRRYVVVAEDLEGWKAEAVRRTNLTGVGLTPRFKRVHPAGPLAANVLGMVGRDGDGLAGVEHGRDAALASAPGRLRWARSAGRDALWVEPDGLERPRRGGMVQITIDAVIQTFAQARLEEAVERANAGGGRLVVVDCRTGEILALTDVLRRRPDWEEELPEDPLRSTMPALARNRCAVEAHEPGSVFKPFVWAAATELGVARPDEIIPCPESGPHRTRSGRLLRDAFPQGPVSWERVLVKSLNTGMAIVAERMSHAELASIVRRFGFGRRTRCGIPGETDGQVTSLADWTDYTQTSVPMGHEIAVTPLQIARAFCAIARDGTMPELYLHLDQVIPVEQRVLRPETARLTRTVLAEVVRGRPTASERYAIFGKSGTAQMPRAAGGGYHEDRYLSSFVAGAPLEDPRIVVVVVIDDPDRSIGHYGSDVAGPAARAVIDEVLTYLGVPPTPSDPEAAEPAGVVARGE